MENWLRDNAKPALLEALNEALHRVENDYQNAYHAENIKIAELHGEIQVLKAQVAKSDWLEQQNENLKAELDQLKRPHKQQKQERQSPVVGRTEARTPLSSLSVNRSRSLGASVKHGDYIDANGLSREELIAEYDKLNGKYGKLRGQFSDVLDANELLKKQLRDKIQACGKWIQHSRTLEAQSNARRQKIEKLKSRLAAVTQDDANSHASFTSETHLAAADRSVRTEGLPEHRVGNDTDVITPWPPLWHDASHDSSMLGGTDETERAPSLPPLPTVSDAAMYESTTKDSSSDSPVVISERRVRKRRRDKSPPGYVPAATRIKREDDSDSITTRERRRFIAQESSIDFDNAGVRITTPRKTRTTRSTSREAPQTALRRGSTYPGGSSSTRGSSPLAFTVHGSTSALVQERERAAADWQEAVHGDEYTEEMENGQLSEVHVAGISTNQAAAEWRQTIQPDRHTEEMDHGQPNDWSSALPTIDTATPKPVARGAKPKAAVPTVLREGIASLAEDGNNPMSAPASASRSAAKAGRLANLLNTTATPEREAISRPATTSTKKTSTGHDYILRLPEKRVLPWQQPENRVGDVIKTPGTPTVSNTKRIISETRPKKMPPDAPEKTKSEGEVPLRQRPTWSLKRSDFKINPRYNEGLDFAYAEVVRGKSRALLPGCSREECCGKLYRPLAEHDLANTSHTAFTSFLEHHLGGDAGSLGLMTQEEKEDMWIDAKIREYSQKHGKHRERHSAMQEPPGWAEIGMPSTQEEIEYREEALRIEAEEIAIRRNEALKRGKYLFVDEDAA